MGESGQRKASYLGLRVRSGASPAGGHTPFPRGSRWVPVLSAWAIVGEPPGWLAPPLVKGKPQISNMAERIGNERVVRRGPHKGESRSAAARRPFLPEEGACAIDY